MDLLLNLLVFLIIIGLIFWAVNTLGTSFGIPQPIMGVVIVVLVIICVIYLLSLVTGSGGLRIPIR